MNSKELNFRNSGVKNTYISVVRNSIGAALMGCLMSCTAPMKTLPGSARPLVLPYQNIHDLGKKSPTPPIGDGFGREFEDLARHLFPDNSPKGSDTVVDDDGNIFTREELKARDK